MPVRVVEMTTVCEYRCRPKILSLTGNAGNKKTMAAVMIAKTVAETAALE